MLKRLEHGMMAAGIAAALSLSAAPTSAQTAEEVAKIEAAMPAKATVQPEKPRKVLVFSQTLGFKHSSVPYAEKALEIMGRKTGAFTAETTTSMDVWDDDVLADYDAIVLNNNTGEHFTEERTQAPLLNFVRNGKGIVGIHAATDSDYKWQAYGELIGGYFDGHPWTANDTVSVKIDEPEHPLNKAFAGKGFDVKDEIYQFREPYSRARSRVLLSLDVDKTDMTKKGIKRGDQDFAVSWVHPYGQGRVFYCSLGHNHEIFWNTAILQHYLDGIQFAIGDLKADAAPRKDAAAKYMQQGFGDLLKAATQMPINGNEKFAAINDAIRAAQTAESRHDLARQIAATLGSGTSMTLAAEQFFANKLSEIGTANEVKVLAELLRDEDVRAADVARSALEKIPGPEAAKVLREALETANPDLRPGIINSLGNRAEAESIDSLKAAAATDETAAVAAGALGRFGTPAAADALLEIWKPAASNQPLERALVECAARMRAKGDVDNAVALYRELFETSKLQASREAALSQLAMLTGSEGEGLAVEQLVAAEGNLQDAAAWAILKIKGTPITQRLVNELDGPATTTQVRLLEMLGTRADTAALPAVKEKAADKNAEVRTEALRALGKLGDESVVEILIQAAATQQGVERDVARESLTKVATGDIDPALIKVLDGSALGDAGKNARKMRAEAARALAARRATAAVPALINAAADSDASLQAEAWKALGAMAEPAQLPQLAGLLPAISSDSSRTEAVKAITEIARRMPEKERTAAVTGLIANVEAPAAQASLLKVLGTLGTAEALDYLRQTRRDATEDAVREAAVRAILDWQDSKAVPDVLDIARTSTNNVEQVLAVRALARLLGKPSNRSADETLALAREALGLAKSAEDKKAVVGGLAEVENPEVFALILPLLDDAEVSEEATAAILKLAPEAYQANPEETRAVLDRLSKDADQARLDKVAEIRNGIEATSTTILGWRVAGPYDAKGKNINQVMSQAFGPETARGKIAWKYAAARKTQHDVRSVDLKEKFGNDSAVIYLAARIYSPVQQDARLLLGSDDGLKVWFNEQVVQEKKVKRPLNPNEDKIDITLKPGWNSVMLKVGQLKGDWAVAARIVSRDGNALENVKIDAGITSAQSASGTPSRRTSVAQQRKKLSRTKEQ